MAGPIQNGDRIGRFIIERPLGAGGMGVVYLARDTLVGIEVALKFFSTQQQEPQQLERFKRELLLTRQVSHPSICRVFDMHEDDGLLFLSMEYVPGVTLRALLDREQTVAIPHTLELGCNLCAAVAAAHRQGVIHRDLKPGNIIVRERNQVSILDFGLAKGLDMASITEAGVRVGTLNYMASEVLRGEAATARSDIYSLGVILYQCLTGRTPYSGDDVMSLYFAQQTPAPVPSSYTLDVTPELDLAIMQAMAVAPDDRQADVEQLRQELLAAMADYPAAEFPIAIEAATADPVRAQRPPTARRPVPSTATASEPTESIHVDGDDLGDLPTADLDRDELDVAIERGLAATPATAAVEPPPLFESLRQEPAVPVSLASSAWPSAATRQNSGRAVRWLVAIAGAVTAGVAALAGWLLLTLEPAPMEGEPAASLATSLPARPIAIGAPDGAASDAAGPIDDRPPVGIVSGSTGHLAEVDRQLVRLRSEQRRRGIIDGDSSEFDAELRRLQSLINQGRGVEAALSARRAHGLLTAIRVDQDFVSRKQHRFNALYDKGHSARNERELNRLADRIIDAIEQQRYPHANRLLNVAIELAGRP